MNYSGLKIRMSSTHTHTHTHTKIYLKLVNFDIIEKKCLKCKKIKKKFIRKKSMKNDKVF